MANFGIILLLLGAYLGNTVAGIACYARNQAQIQRTHMRNPNYPVLLNEYEIAGAVVGALPGLTIFLIARRRKAAVALQSEQDE